MFGTLSLGLCLVCWGFVFYSSFSFSQFVSPPKLSPLPSPPPFLPQGAPRPHGGGDPHARCGPGPFQAPRQAAPGPTAAAVALTVRAASPPWPLSPQPVPLLSDQLARLQHFIFRIHVTTICLTYFILGTMLKKEPFDRPCCLVVVDVFAWT